MSVDAFTEQVAAALDDAAVRHLNFRIRSRTRGFDIRIYPDGYRRVKEAILNETIRVRQVATGNLGCYDSTGNGSRRSNLLQLPPVSQLSSELAWKALVIHECTHALNDYHLHRIPVYVDEATAYIAHQLFMLLHERRVTDAGDLRYVFDYALVVADGIRRQYELDYDDANLGMLFTAISSSRTYGDTASTTNAYDGL